VVPVAAVPVAVFRVAALVVLEAAVPVAAVAIRPAWTSITAKAAVPAEACNLKSSSNGAKGARASARALACHEGAA